MGNPFSGIGEVELFEKGNFLTAGGSYDLEVRKIILKNTRKSGLGFIVEFTVLDATGVGAENHAPGSKATWFQKMEDKDVALPAVKEFFVGLLGINMNNKEEKEEFNSQLEDILDEATSWEPDGDEDEHPLAGEKVHVETFSKLTKKGLDFTAHVWSAYSEGDDAA